MADILDGKAGHWLGQSTFMSNVLSAQMEGKYRNEEKLKNSAGKEKMQARKESGGMATFKPDRVTD